MATALPNHRHVKCGFAASIWEIVLARGINSKIMVAILSFSIIVILEHIFETLWLYFSLLRLLLFNPPASFTG